MILLLAMVVIAYGSDVDDEWTEYKVSRSAAYSVEVLETFFFYLTEKIQ